MVGRLFTVAAFALAINACSDSSGAPTESSSIPDSPAFGVTVAQFHEDFGPTTTTNPCLPEDVSFAGKIHRTVKTREDGSIEVRTNYADLKGVGLTTGNEYVLHQNTFFHVLDPLPLPLSQTIRVYIRVISRGGADNHYLIVEQSTTIAPPAPPLIVTNIESECRG